MSWHTDGMASNVITILNVPSPFGSLALKANEPI